VTSEPLGNATLNLQHGKAREPAPQPNGKLLHMHEEVNKVGVVGSFFCAYNDYFSFRSPIGYQMLQLLIHAIVRNPCLLHQLFHLETITPLLKTHLMSPHCLELI
jgi:hypothetical protein